MTDPRIVAYLDFFGNIARDRLIELNTLTTDDVHFVDPFHDVRGRAAMRALLERMFDTMIEPRFIIERSAAAGDFAFVSWQFSATLNAPRRMLRLTGASELHFDADGRVRTHIDHWDAARQIYEQVPVLGFILRHLRQRLAGDR